MKQRQRVLSCRLTCGQDETQRVNRWNQLGGGAPSCCSTRVASDPWCAKGRDGTSTSGELRLRTCRKISETTERRFPPSLLTFHPAPRSPASSLTSLWLLRLRFEVTWFHLRPGRPCFCYRGTIFRSTSAAKKRSLLFLIRLLV